VEVSLGKKERLPPQKKKKRTRQPIDRKEFYFTREKNQPQETGESALVVGGNTLQRNGKGERKKKSHNFVTKTRKGGGKRSTACGRGKVNKTKGKVTSSPSSFGGGLLVEEDSNEEVEKSPLCR